MITIGQLARYAGVTTKTIRVYHDKGVLPEPERDSSGYRRYNARDVATAIRARTLSQAGVPLADVRELFTTSGADFAAALHQVDQSLSQQIRDLRDTQRRLRALAAQDPLNLPGEVVAHLDRLPNCGFTARWVAIETDLWILVFATLPDEALELFRDQTDAVDDPRLRELYLAYDAAHDLRPDDPRIEDLAERIAEVARERYAQAPPPGHATRSNVPDLIQSTLNEVSPAWQRLAALIAGAAGNPHGST